MPSWLVATFLAFLVFLYLLFFFLLVFFELGLVRFGFEGLEPRRLFIFERIGLSVACQVNHLANPC